MILFPILFQIACGLRDAQMPDYQDAGAVKKMDMTTKATDMTPIPSFNCEKDRLDPSKTIERTKGQYSIGEHEMFYDCKLQTYCVKYDDPKLGPVCWPYFQSSDWSMVNMFQSNELDEQLIGIYMEGTYYTRDSDVLIRQHTTPIEYWPNHLHRTFDTTQTITSADFFKFR